MYRRAIILGGLVGVLLFIIALGVFSTINKNSTNGLSVELPAISTPDIIDIPEIIFKTEDVLKPVELPFGGRELIPGNRFVALYGSPVYSSLGSLGEQSLEETIARANAVTAEYQQFSEEKVIPTFEIIMTVAAAGPTDDNDYSQVIDPAQVKGWIDAAKENNFYVVLDLQPGRSTFLSQAKLYEALLKEPHVGLALDPEWRLQKESDRHLVSIGSVDATEINETAEWLADLTKTNKLPQKLFMIHQFKPAMITNRETMKTDREELAYMIHMDGHGAPGSKTGSWNNIKENLPVNVHLGWKNFYDEDKPTPTPEQTMQQIPKPWLVSYQ